MLILSFTWPEDDSHAEVTGCRMEHRIGSELLILFPVSMKQGY